MPTPSAGGLGWQALGVLLAVVLGHGVIWAWVLPEDGVPALLDRYDSAWYSRVVRDGYPSRLPDGRWERNPGVWAFHPLEPMLTRALWLATGRRLHPGAIGAGLSLGACLALIWLVERRRRRSALPGGVAPATSWGWALLWLSPASFVLHTHHSEGLFLLLAWIALSESADGRPLRAAAWAGLASLARATGIFLAVAVAVEAALGQRGWRRVLAFAGCGLISMAIWSPWPLTGYVRTGDPSAWARAHDHWWPTGDGALERAARGVVLGNPWQADQRKDPWMVGRYGTLLALIVVAVGVGRRRPALGVFFALVLVLPFTRGDPLHAAMRFVAVLFPLWFAAGDRLSRMPWVARWALLLLLIALNASLTARYALGTLGLEPY